jgi:hypothetical protein
MDCGKTQSKNLVHRDTHPKHGKYFGNLLHFQNCKEKLGGGKNRFPKFSEFI